MKTIDLAQSIGILANVGVIAGIVFLAVELQQNNELLGAQAREYRQELRRDMQARYLETPGLIAATVKARNGEGLTRTEHQLISRGLTEEEAYLLRIQNNATVIDWRFIFQEYQEGLIDEQQIVSENWPGIFATQPGLRERWSELKTALTASDPAFVQYFEENIVNR